MCHSYMKLLATETEWPFDEKRRGILLKILTGIAKGDIFQMIQSPFELNLVKPLWVVVLRFAPASPYY